MFHSTHVYTYISQANGGILDCPCLDNLVSNMLLYALLLSPEQEVSLYEASHDLEYLDMVVQESLRMYPSLPRYIK